jgi:hypothetical protein
MNMTKHAKQKQRRRGITDLHLKIIEHYGRNVKAPGGATKIFLGKRERQEIIGNLKYTIQSLDKCCGTIVEIDGMALTVYK